MIEAIDLDQQGFVVDFTRLKQQVLEPCHRMLDHGYAVGRELCTSDVIEALRVLGRHMLETRRTVHGTTDGTGHWLLRRSEIEDPSETLHGAFDVDLGGLKLIVFPFPPTSERLARWLAGLAEDRLADDRVSIHAARVYEVLHPVESMAEYLPRR